jgi:transaldolase
MKFFIDSADIEEIKQANKKGWVDGVTTNPTLIAKSGRDFHTVIKEICKEVRGPVSAEVIATQADEMVKEGMTLAKLADNVVVKIPLIEEGLVAVKRLSAEGIKTNVTLVFNPLQALLVAKAGGTMVSPFVGRLDDIGQNGMAMVEEIVQIFRNFDFTTEVLVASVRSPLHIQQAALIGADTVTVPYKVMQQMTQHPLTDKGLKMFLDDWNKVSKK